MKKREIMILRIIPITWTILLNKGAKAWDEGIFSIEDTLDSNL